MRGWFRKKHYKIEAVELHNPQAFSNNHVKYFKAKIILYGTRNLEFNQRRNYQKKSNIYSEPRRQEVRKKKNRTQTKSGAAKKEIDQVEGSPMVERMQEIQILGRQAC